MRAARVALTVLLVVIAGGTPVSPAGARTELEPPGSYGMIPDQLYAIRNPYLFKHNAGLLGLQITNLGLIGNPFIDDLSAGWRGAEYLFFSGLWIGAISGAEAHVSTSTPLELRPDLDARWTIYESFEGMKGGVRLGAQGMGVADDDGDGLLDEDFHNGLDDDDDSLIDEDYAAIGQQMLSCIYRDDTAEAVAQVPGHFPLGLLIRQRSFQWATQGIAEFVGFEFEIINAGQQRLKEFHFGFYSDSDIGIKDDDTYWNDDLAGWDIIDTTLTIGQGACATVDATIPAAFMWDGGGSVPGVFGSLLLGHPTDDTGLRAPQNVDFHTVEWFSATVDGDPDTDVDRYQLMASGIRRADHPRAGVATGSTSTPDDYRMVWATGRFGGSFDPGESRVFSIAQVVGEGFSGFRENAAGAWLVYNGRYVDADGNPDTGIDGKERCLQILEPGGQIVWDDPCDTLAVEVVYENTPPCDVAGSHHVDADCDPCTGINGWETQVHWIGAVAPPSPTTNLDPSLYPFNDPDLQYMVRPAGDGRITVQWDNASEIWREPLTGMDIFTGYRIWKVSDWADSLIGPGPEDWVQVAEFREDVQISNPDHLRNVTNLTVPPIGTTGGGQPIYPIGRYEFVDTDVVNELWYFYTVTAFGIITTTEGTTELAGLPASPLSWGVVPGGSVPVRLLSFSVNRLAETARVEWVVAEAENHAGFHVHREQPGTERIRLTKTLLTGGFEYVHVDLEAPPGEVSYWLEELSRTGETTWHGPLTLAPMTSLPGKLAVGMASPNPFHAGTSLAYSLPGPRPVRVSVYDISGRRVRVLVDETQGPGDFTARWRARTDGGARVAPGLYFIRFETGELVRTRKVLFVP